MMMCSTTDEFIKRTISKSERPTLIGNGVVTLTGWHQWGCQVFVSVITD